MIGRRLLVVDDEENLLRVTQLRLEQAGYEVSTATGGEQALALLAERPFDLVLTDLRMPGLSGVELLGRIRESWPEAIVVLMTAYGTVESAVEAMKLGAFDYVIKPVHAEALRMMVERALEHHRLKEQVRELRSAVDRKYGFESIVGRAKPLLAVLDAAARAAQSDSTVLIRGETGTGKELLARAIHFNSPRREGPFVVINCGAIPRDLLESELFGHTKGAFTGALADKKGKVELAEGGTLFLDEIGEMPPELQVKVLRLLQDREVEKIGAPARKVDVRMVAATHRDLRARVEDGRFREDLYYRLAVIPLTLPPLRERVEDIAELAVLFFRRYAEKMGRGGLRLPQSLLPYFTSYRWPGNVRELENVMERLVVLAPGEQVTVEDLPEFLRREKPALEALQLEMPAEGISLEAVERELIVRALARFGGNQTKAAEYLDISRKTLIYRMEKHGLREE
jgi:two-component system NtrC family response regulator